MAIVGRVDDNDIGLFADFERANFVADAKCMGGVDGASVERFGRVEFLVTTCDRHGERRRQTRGRAGVMVGAERECTAIINKSTGVGKLVAAKMKCDRG